MKTRIENIKNFLCRKDVIFSLWILLPLIAWVTKYFPSKYNNFLIFRGSFFHTIEKLPLYEAYPAEYNDLNHYGPFFACLIAPFAVMPMWLSLLSWLLALSLSLYWAIKTLPLNKMSYVFIYWICAHELLTGLFMSQFNIAIASILILSFTLIEREKDFWAAFCIAIGFMVKLYGIVGLAFFFFSKHKIKFILSGIFWLAVMFVLPMTFSSPDYIISQYSAWINELISKNDSNLFSLYQNISLLGLVRKITQNPNYSDLLILIPAVLLFFAPYTRVKQYKYLPFRMAILASALICTVILSTGSESSTYIIAFCGVAIWYKCVPWKRTKWDLALLIFAFILTSMSPSDLFPKYLRQTYVIPYALKALPCVIIWLKLSYELLTRNYNYENDTI
ncbi:MAG: DUF2029 domain-containing protein [Bacteroidales bacterium]|nr:DUF2029 domain-containing protein [Bacteroidales bacterium]MBQ7819739.1 DUF2029 domain-containing protein [Bacteroidales bacterium]